MFKKESFKSPKSLGSVWAFILTLWICHGEVKAQAQTFAQTLKTASYGEIKPNQILISIDQYLNASKNNSDQNIYYNIRRSLQWSDEQKFITDMNLNWSQHESYLYIHVSDLYYSLNNFSLGFKKLPWSTNLDFFHSSEWQQQMERNKLNPKTGGNFGFFYKAETENMSADFLFSPFFMPTRGPHFKFTNGQPVSDSPWFLTPPTEVPYDGEIFATRYQLEDIKYADFLKHQSYAFRFQAVDGPKWSFNFAYANKPSPKLVTDLDFQANVSDQNVPIDIFIRPRVVRHQLVSSELSYKFSEYSRFTMGYMNEAIDKQSVTSSSETFMQPLDQNVFSIVYSQTNERWGLSIGALWRDGGRSRSFGELASALASQNLNYLYEQAIKIDFSYFQTWGWTLHTSMSYDFLQKGLLTTASFQRTLNNTLITLGFDALEPINTSDEASFIYQYRNLDRVWAGVSYVF